MVIFGEDPEGAQRFELWHHDGGRRGLMPPGAPIDRVHWVSRDGTLAFAESRDWTFWRLDLKAGRALPLFVRHPSDPWSMDQVSVSDDGRLVVVASATGTSVWDAQAPRLLAQAPGNERLEGFSAGYTTWRRYSFAPMEGSLWKLGPDERAVRDPSPYVAVLPRPDRELAVAQAKGELIVYAGAAPVAKITFPDEVVDVHGWSPDGRKLLVVTPRDTRLLDLSSM